MSRIYYRGAKAAIVCYDLTDSSSFERAKFWVKELRSLEEGCQIYLCGTKSDLLEEDRRRRRVDFHDVQDYADNIKAQLFETSSKTGQSVDELFQKVAEDYVSVAAFQVMTGSVDGGYGQGDPRPEKLNGHHHLDTGSLPPLDCAGPLQGWVQALLRHCLLPTPHRASKKSCYVKSLSFKQEPVWISQVTSPSTLGSAYLYHEISTIITFLCTKHLSIHTSIYTTAISGPAALA
nr:ras-related protein Rab-24 isoform X2 [Ictidomys tridecemlineatus]